MTEIATYQPQQPAAAQMVVAPRRLMEWAQEANAAHELAETLCQTAFCPETFRGKPGEATAAILAGSEVGLSPMAALNAYDVIQGRPAPKAITLRALVQSAGHDIWLESATSDCVVMKGRRRGSNSVQQSKWDMKRARDAKLTNKPNWQNQPQNMLTARATSEIARLVGADVILGIPYSAEELLDLEPEPTMSVVRTATRPATAKRKALAPVPEPDFDPPSARDDPPHEDTPGTELRTEAQSTKIFAAAREVFDHPDKLRPWIAALLGRPLESTKTLTKAEASQVIEALEAAIHRPDPDTGKLPVENSPADWPDVQEPPA